MSKKTKIDKFPMDLIDPNNDTLNQARAFMKTVDAQNKAFRAFLFVSDDEKQLVSRNGLEESIKIIYYSWKRRVDDLAKWVNAQKSGTEDAPIVISQMVSIGFTARTLSLQTSTPWFFSIVSDTAPRSSVDELVAFILGQEDR